MTTSTTRCPLTWALLLVVGGLLLLPILIPRQRGIDDHGPAPERGRPSQPEADQGRGMGMG